jgi:uncharacterized protein (DUF1800 family)
MDTRIAQAMIRFGLGCRRSEPLPNDPAAWLAGQVHAPDPARFDGLPDTADGLAALREDRKNKPAPGASLSLGMFRADGKAQMEEVVQTPSPFRERLVWFWANHFTVSRRQGGVTAIAGPFVREAIRPHVFGHFHDMLLAVMRHPAMLLYLDNAVSAGPGSIAGQRRHIGLNENLARESLELHTVSPASGYTQADVTRYAAILTGWSIDLQGNPPGFLFRPRLHEPGAKTLMGHSFPEGEEGGLQALAFLARHPATHRHLATKLVTHFVADSPMPEAVSRIEAVLRDTDGDLGAASLALIERPEAWTPLTKLRSPQDLMFATLRAADLPADVPFNGIGVLAVLGQPLWLAPFPIGWSDRAADWAGPEAILRRVDWTYGFSGRLGGMDPMEVADASLGPLLRPATRDAIRHAGSRRDAFTMLFSSPEFQRH